MQAAFQTRAVSDGFEDSSHFFLEECDRAQGIQTFVDLHDGFSGLGSAMVTMLRDDHGKIPIFCFGFVPPYALKHAAANVVNEVLGLLQLAASATLMVPMAGSNGWSGQIDRRAAAAAGAPAISETAMKRRLATVIDTVSLGYRLKHDGHYMGEVASMLVGSRRGFRNFAMAGGSVPLFDTSYRTLDLDPTKAKMSAVLGKLGSTPFNDTKNISYYCPGYTPRPSETADPISAMYAVLRGVGDDRLRPTAAELAVQGSSTEFDRYVSHHA